MTTKFMKNKSVTQRQQLLDSQGASVMADGVKKISSPEEKTSSSDKIATDSKSAKNSSNKKATGLPIDDENKKKSLRDLSDSKLSHSNSSNEEGEIVNEGKQPSNDDEKPPIKQSKKRS
jgi:hypothetical protein